MDNFRDSYFPVTWDLTKKHLRGTFWGKQYDTGRGFAVTIVEGGQVTVPSTETVRLKWEKPDSTEGYVTAVVVDGKFIIENIDQMFTVHGAVRSDLEIWRGGKVISSITFYVSVEKAVAVDAIESSSDFTALQEALADVGDMQDQVDAVIANATVDSEVILARGTEPTLGARLDADKAEVSAQLAEIVNTTLSVAKVNPPKGFTLIPDFNIYRGGDRNFITDFNIDDYQATEGKTYYVDGAIGLDTNVGTELAPFKSIKKAVQMADVDIVYIKPMLYDSELSWNDANPNRDLTIKRWGDSGYIISSMHFKDLVWTLHEGNVYTTTVASAVSVFDKNNIDEFGNAIRLNLKNSIADVVNNANSFFLSDTTLYVRTHDNRVPDADIFVYKNTRNGRYHAIGKKLWMEHMSFEGGSYPFIIADASALFDQRGYFKDCKFNYSGYPRNGFAVTSAGKYYLVDCESSSNAQDGFNYDRILTSPGPDIVEIGCKGYKNGLPGAYTNNCSTVHNGTRIIRINCDYAESYGRVVHDIVASQSWNLNVKARKTLSDGSQMSDASFGCGVLVDNTLMWLDTCEAFESPKSLYVSGQSSVLYLRNTYQDSAENYLWDGGRIKQY